MGHFATTAAIRRIRTCAPLLLAVLMAFTVAARAGATAATPTVSVLSDEMTVSHWADPQAPATIRATPSVHAASVGALHYLTEDGQYEVYLVLKSERDPATNRSWYEIRVPRRPNGILGWVPQSALGPLQVAYGHLLVDRGARRATLYNRYGKSIWSAPIGVGRPNLPTPAGRFYVREKLRAIGGPFYGPYAFGTSAYAPSLSEWPGGGVIGIHGTNEPALVPGDPSHGCVRVRNADIVRLWSLLSIGTPIEIV